MSPQTIAEIGRISAAIVAALREAHTMAGRGERGPELTELVRHAREMCDALTDVLDRTGDVEQAVRNFATTLAAGLDDMERSIGASPLQ